MSTPTPAPARAAVLAYRDAHATATHEEIAQATGVALQYVRQVLALVRGERGATLVDKVGAYVAANPGARPVDAQKALDLPKEQVKGAWQTLRERGEIPDAAPRSNQRAVSPELARALLPMLPGAGERRDDCAHYPEHVDRAGAATSGEAHCPSPCPQYQKRPREYDRAAAMMAREASSYAMHVRT